MRRVLALTFLGVLTSMSGAPVNSKSLLNRPPKNSVTAHPTRKKSRRGVHRPPAPTYQLQPDPERYQEIQKALADRGYFKGETNGLWGDDSIDALRRFQVDQKLTDDGKISALTLIGLGLGPKHDSSSLTPK